MIPRDVWATGHLAAALTARMATLNPSQVTLAKRMSEAGLMRAVRRAVATLGHRAYHTARSDRSDAGFPDLVIVGRGGLLCRELKTETGALTCDQLDWLCALRAAGVDADVWRPTDLLSGRISQSLASPRRAGRPEWVRA